MDDDFNTAEAISVLFDLATELNRSREAALALQLKGLAGLLGLLERDPVAFLQADLPLRHVEGLDPVTIEGRIAARLSAKKAKNYREADAIRTQLLEAGIVLEDTPQGTTWRRA
jgi:cysteinyl-tRNA synthetase